MDPLTSGVNARSVVVTLSNSFRALAGDDIIRFGLGMDACQFSATAADATIEACLEATDELDAVSVTTLPPSVPSVGRTLVVTINNFKGPRRNLFRHEGNPPLSFFFCDVSLASGLTVYPTGVSVHDDYTITIASGGSQYWYQGSTGAAHGPYTILSSGNKELGVNVATLMFKATSGWPNGYAWKVKFDGATALVFPPLFCSVADADQSVTVSGTYTGSSASTYTLKVAGRDGSTGINNYQWKTSDSASDYSAPVAVTGGAQLMTQGLSVQFANEYAHGAGAVWTLLASGPAPSAILNGRATSLTASGFATTTVNMYRVVISAGTSSPPTFRTSVSCALSSPT